MYQILFYNKSMNDCRTHTMAIIESTPEYGGIINTMSKFKKMMSTTLAGLYGRIRSYDERRRSKFAGCSVLSTRKFSVDFGICR